MNKVIKQNGFVYIAEATDGTIKIGQTQDFNKRIKQLGKNISRFYLSNPMGNSLTVESAMHKAFCIFSIGREWYRNLDFDTACYHLYLLENGCNNNKIDLEITANILILSTFESNCIDYRSRGLCNVQYCKKYKSSCITDDDFDLVFKMHGNLFNYENRNLLLTEIASLKHEIIAGRVHKAVTMRGV